MLEAVCQKCGETFIPDNERDTLHLWSMGSGEDCGGQGIIVAEIDQSSTPRKGHQSCGKASGERD
jgi:hypothetical protein